MVKTITQADVAAGIEPDEPEFDFSEYEVLVPAEDGLPPVYTVTPEQGRRLFDAAVRREMGISGEEFIQRWEAGEYWGIADEEGHRHIGDLIMMIPLARQDS
ncbi:MAG: hypothetical protein ACR2LS_02205 [Thermomicrobiales bacterium]